MKSQRAPKSRWWYDVTPERQECLCEYLLWFSCSFGQILIVGETSFLIMSPTFYIHSINYFSVFCKTLLQQLVEKPKRDYRIFFFKHLTSSIELPCFYWEVIWGRFCVQMCWNITHDTIIWSLLSSFMFLCPLPQFNNQTMI